MSWKLTREYRISFGSEHHYPLFFVIEINLNEIIVLVSSSNTETACVSLKSSRIDARFRARGERRGLGDKKNDEKDSDRKPSESSYCDDDELHTVPLTLKWDSEKLCITSYYPR